MNVSTHSHPKVAACSWDLPDYHGVVSTHSHPKVAAIPPCADYPNRAVSTHSHPKVAAAGRRKASRATAGFNTQPPEGGCFAGTANQPTGNGFNTQPPEGGC